MIRTKKKLNKNELTAYSLSILIHGIFLFILIMIGIKYSPAKKTGAVVQFVKVAPPKAKKVSQIRSLPVKREIRVHQKKEKVKVPSTQTKEAAITKVDTTLNKQEIKIAKSEPADSIKERLKFAKTFLDTFLIRNPEFARYILKQQAKYLMQNQTQRMMTRLEMQKKISDELHKYVKEHFPEGSEHAMSEIGGPGMQIPIDGLIDAIKKLFQ